MGKPAPPTKAHAGPAVVSSDVCLAEVAVGSPLVSRVITERSVPEDPREGGPGAAHQTGGRDASVTFYSGGRAVVFARLRAPKGEADVCPNHEADDEAESHQPTPRNVVTKFSRGSRLRLRRKLNRLERSEVPLFVTLTYPAEERPTPDAFGVHTQRYKVAFRRRFPNAGFVWKVEFTRRGVPHLHLLVFGADYATFREWHVPTWVRCIGTAHPSAAYVANRGVEPVRSAVSVSAYVGKYVWGDKTYQEDGGTEWSGRRWWGLVNEAQLPWAEAVNVAVPDVVVGRLIRYARKRGSVYNARWQSRLGWARPWWKSKARKAIPARRYPTLEYECDPTTWGTLLAFELQRHAERQARRLGT